MAANASAWKAAQVVGVVVAVVGAVFAALSAIDAVTVAFLWIALVLGAIGIVCGLLAVFAAPRNARTTSFNPAWGFILGGLVVLWAVFGLINAAGL